MPDITLHAETGKWRIFAGRKVSKSFQAVAKKVFARDNYTCRFCGFQAQEYQDIVNLDHNYQNNRGSNLVTACCFCSQCFFIESVGLDGVSGGQIIYLPEISQGELNSLCHVLFCAMGSGDTYQDSAQSIYRSLRLRSQVVEKEIGPGLSNPATFGQVLIETKDKFPKANYEFINKLRLLPAFTKFKMQLNVWTNAALAELAQADEKEE